MEAIIQAVLTGSLSEPIGTNQLDDMQVRGAFDFETNTYTGYDYKHQVWVEAGLPTG